MCVFQFTDAGLANVKASSEMYERIIPFDAWALREYTVYLMGLGLTLEMASEAAIDTPMLVRLHTLRNKGIEHPYLQHVGRCL